MGNNQIEVVFSFDTTGSMYPCLTQVRKKVKNTVTRLFKEIPGIKVGVFAHGDYCDAKSTYVTKHLDLASKPEPIVKFVETVKATGGGDFPECYELVLHEAQSISWSKGATKVLVVIGDATPHGPKDNPKKLDWKVEAKKLKQQGVAVYAVQALGYKPAEKFYQGMAKATGGLHLPLEQFAHITDLVHAIAYKQHSDDRVKAYEQEVIKAGRASRSITKAFDVLLKRKSKFPSARSLHAVPPGRFQVLDVDKDMPIQKFVEHEGLTFQRGRGFYEFTKSETIQGYKDVVLMEKGSGDLFDGNKAKAMIGMTPGETARLAPAHLDKYAVFVQSTSNNRRLVGGTRFLYEVEDWGKV